MAFDSPRALAGRRVLLVEDEFLIADDIALAFARLGVTVVGPVPTLARALSAIENSEHLDGAVLDINLRGEMAYPVADLLAQRGVPFVFATGYDQSVIPKRYRHVPWYEKPLIAEKVVQALLKQR
jgi:CheY-like chemotaxis protein